MRRLEVLLPVLSAIIVLVMIGVSDQLSPHAAISMQSATPTSTPAMPPVSTGHGILLNLPPGASQSEFGAEIYRLVCRDCHGDKGQGLTDEWRSTWAPSDQNCWKSKCHAANHPPDGFTMPIAPAVVGTAAMARFYTASDLHDFIVTYMPWQAPGELNDEQYWQVTAYILKMNNIDPGINLDAQNALAIRLGRKDVPPPAQTAPENQWPPFYILALVVILLILLIFLVLGLRRILRR